MKSVFLLSLGILTSLAAIPSFAQPQPSVGKTYLVAVGVSTYNQSRTGFINIDQAAEDAIKVVNRLQPEGSKNQVAFYLAQYDSNTIPKPTAANLRNTLKEIAERVGPDDRVVICMIGHGINTKNHGDVFCTSDCDYGNPNSMVAVSEIVARVKLMKAKEKIVFIDACRKIVDHYVALDSENKPILLNGSSSPKLIDIAVHVEMPEAPPPPTPSVSRPAVKDNSRMIVIQSCKAGHPAYISLKNSKAIMSSRLVEAVEGAADTNSDGKVTTAEIIAHLHKYVPEDARTMRQEIQDIEVRDEGLRSAFALVEYPKEKLGKLTPAKAQSELSVAHFQNPIGYSGDSYASRPTSYGSGLQPTQAPVASTALDWATGRGLSVGGISVPIPPPPSYPGSGIVNQFIGGLRR